MPSFEECRNRLGDLRHWHDDADHKDPKRNESSTRFHLIDRLLKEVLGWEPEDIKVERYEQSTYTDYELGRPAPQVVVEAKREGVAFTLPAGSSGRHSLTTLISGSAAVADAIKQAMGYGHDRGIPLSAVANGDQLVVFLASRLDGVPPIDGDCVAFESLDDMESRFQELWDLLSPAAVATRRSQSILQTQSLTTPPARLSQRLVEYPGFKNRNPVAAELQVLGGVFIEDLAMNREVEAEFLRIAYCESGALSQYAMVAREVLKARYSVFFEKETGVSIEPANTRGGLSQSFLQDVLASSLSQRPIIILGDVGVGKTTFIRHFIRVEAAEVMAEAIQLYVDFGREPALSDDLRTHVRDSFAQQLLEKYDVDVDERQFVRGVYHADLARFENGIFGDLIQTDPGEYRRREIEYLSGLIEDRDSHLRRALEHIQRGRRRQIVVFLDNVDQRSAVFQDEVFLIAEALASTWPVTVFVSLRPETFQRSKVDGALSGYQPRVFTIHPPRIDRVVQKRIEFARSELETYGSLPGFPEGVTMDSERIESYLRMLHDAFISNSEVVSFIDNICGGSVRRALEIVMRFVGSGHVDNRKILEILDRSGYYTLPLHEFVRAVMLGDYEHYDPRDSPIGNLFDLSTNDGKEHFLLPVILSVLEGAGGGSQGFVETQSVYSRTQELGFLPGQIDAAVMRGLNFRMMETYPRFDDPSEARDAIRLRVTTAGAYTVRSLMRLFAYVDLTVVDTPIVDNGYRDRIRDVHSISDRLQRARVFLSYLDAQYVANPILAESPFDWSTTLAALDASISEVERRTGTPRVDT